MTVCGDGIQQDNGKDTKPHYNSVDLSELELEDVSPSDVSRMNYCLLFYSLIVNLARETNSPGIVVQFSPYSHRPHILLSSYLFCFTSEHMIMLEIAERILPKVYKLLGSKLNLNIHLDISSIPSRNFVRRENVRNQASLFDPSCL